jgi:hypothetical protein
MVESSLIIKKLKISLDLELEKKSRRTEIYKIVLSNGVEMV